MALRPREAAAALGISERKLRQLLPALPHYRSDGVVLIPVDLLREFLNSKARDQQIEDDLTIDEIF